MPEPTLRADHNDNFQNLRKPASQGIAKDSQALPVPVTLAIVDPNGAANLSQYDSHLFNGIRHDALRRFMITSRQFQAGALPGSDILRFYDYKRFRSGVGKGLSYLAGNLRTYCFILRKPVRIVHFQWFKLPTMDWLGLRVLRVFSKSLQIIYTAHNVLPHDSGDKYFTRYRRIYRLVDAIVVHTSASKRELIDRFGIAEAKVHVIPHGILHPPACEANQSIELPPQMRDCPHVVTILGLIHRYKGHDRAISAWKNSVVSTAADWLLVIAGKGDPEYVAELRRKAGNCPSVLIIDRFLEDSEFYSLSRKSCLSLFPYRRISQSGALLTHLAFAKPFVVADVGGLAEPLRIADLGWAFGNSDFAQSLTRLLDELVKDDAGLRRRTQDVRGWKAVWNHYSWSGIGVQTLFLYATLAQDSELAALLCHNRLKVRDACQAGRVDPPPEPLLRGAFMYHQLLSRFAALPRPKPAKSSPPEARIVSRDRSGYGGRRVSTDHRCPEPEYQNVLPLMKGRKVFVDIGAHTGIYSLRVARYIAEGGLVICFEPNPEVASDLFNSIQINRLNNVRLRVCCVSDEARRITLRLKPDSPKRVRLNHAPGKPHSFATFSMTLDQIAVMEQLPSLDYLKVAADGSQKQILAGGKRAIEHFKPIIQYAKRSCPHLPLPEGYRSFELTGSPNGLLLHWEDPRLLEIRRMGYLEVPPSSRSLAPAPLAGRTVNPETPAS